MTITTRVRTHLALSAAALILGAGLAAGTASAATMSCTTTGNGNSSATFSLSASTAAECYSGNDSNQVDASFTLFGMTGWTLSDKNDDAASGTQDVTFALAPVNGTKSGPWAIADYAGYKNVAITLKAGNGFGAFLLDTASMAGLWSSSKDLSHASIYTNGKPDTPAPVPLPAAAWMLLAGLGGLGAVARRRKGAAS